MKIFTALLLSVLIALPATAEETDSIDLDVIDISFESKQPFFRPIFGQSAITLENTTDIENSLTVGVVLGFEGTRRVQNSNILRTQTNGLFVIHHAEQEASSETYSITAWRFGFSTGESYGYGFSEESNAGLYLGSEKAPLTWSSITISSTPDGIADPQGAERLQRFPDALRFGESSTASVGVRVIDAVSVSAGFEWSQTYERHLFWKWAGSAIIEGVADGAASWFVRAIGKNSPAAMPIMHFILRNGVALGFKALRQDQMNWPFTSAAPLNFQTYTIGVNVVF